MAEGGKFVVRPKVRFCQREDDDEDQESAINERILSIARKPSIKSIITIDKPYKIVSLDPLDETLTPKNSSLEELTPERSFEDRENICGYTKRVLNDFNEEDSFASTLRKFAAISSSEKGSPVESSRESQHFSNQTPSIDSSFSSKEDLVENPEIVEVEVHAEDFPELKIQNGSKTSEDVQTFSKEPDNFIPNQLKFSEDAFLKPPEKKNLSAIQEESVEFDIQQKEDSPEPEPLKIPEDLKLTSKKAEPKSPKKTFKCTSPLKRQLISINRLSRANKSPKKSISQENTKRLPTANSKMRARPLGFIQRSGAKPKVCGVMPCMKAKMASKGKTSPVKKSVLRNVVAQTNIGKVEPGVVRPRRELKVDFQEEPKVNSHVLPAEKLSRPEYNSIMCTINKLKEVQKENIITDVEHLPLGYKSLVNGKVSSALDFAPDEAIFKNLINLSIEESQLPPRFTRSKDPEPRQRDAVPQLSDFFIPKYGNEYCTAVCAKPRTPEPVENWSAFRISDKILSWKWNMDYVH